MDPIAPSFALAAPGECQIKKEFVSLPLTSRKQLSKDTYLFVFATPDTTKPLNLSTCACILAKFTDTEGADVVRPYTPISTNESIGMFECIIKVYPNGKMTQHLLNMEIGASLDFKHIPFNVKIQYPFGKKFIGMLVGGTGVTPMIQALHALLGNKEDETEISMLYGSQTSDNILCEGQLNKWVADFDRFKVTYVLNNEPEESSWKGPRGFITKEMIEASFPKPGSDLLIFVCGPPPMYDAFCGPRGDKDKLSGILADLGYSNQEIVKF